MKHFEVFILVKNGAPARKGVIAKDAIEAINKAVAAVEGAAVGDVDRVVQLGIVDVT